jgi:flagellar basal-body rod protein FlgG
MAALQTRIAAEANNLANADTPGFKATRVMVEEEAPGRGVRIAETLLDMNMGSPMQTGRPLDVMIFGDGFFCVQGDGGQLWTRAGSFAIDHDGTLVVGGSKKRPLVPPITVPNGVKTITIEESGEVTCFENHAELPTALGQIELATFAAPERLQPMGASLFAESPGSGPPVLAYPGVDGRGKLEQETLEASNVDEIRSALEIGRLRRRLEVWYRLVMSDAGVGYAAAR